jgi:hypothetical protein
METETHRRLFSLIKHLPDIFIFNSQSFGVKQEILVNYCRHFILNNENEMLNSS